MAVQEKGLWWRVGPFNRVQTGIVQDDSFWEGKNWLWEVWYGGELIHFGYSGSREMALSTAHRKYLRVRDSD